MQLHGFPNNMVLLDCETTGGKATVDRITEIALIVVENGYITERWQQLINSDTLIPPWISKLTGITDDMLISQPRFEDIADTLLDKLEGKTLVAHNARFDYGFLKNEFKRVGIDYTTKPLCSVKLSRRLNPQFKRHGLDAVIERLSIPITARHRAMDDTEAIFHLFRHFSQTCEPEEIEAVCKSLLTRSSTPSHLPDSEITKLPCRPGVYRFYSANGQLLYVGKSISIKDRVLNHFSSDHSNAKDLKISQQVTHIDFTETPSDFGAQLLENREIKDLSPALNRRQTRTRKLYQLAKAHDSQGYSQLSIVPSDINNIGEITQRFGLFRSKKTAESTLRNLADRYQLCHRLAGLEKRASGGCFAHQLHRCTGACMGKETAELYNLRTDSALTSIKNLMWPWPSAILVTEPAAPKQDKNQAADTAQAHYHLIDQWVYLGQIENESALEEHLSSCSEETTHFDLDAYLILIRFLMNPRMIQQHQLQITALHKQTPDTKAYASFD